MTQTFGISSGIADLGLWWAVAWSVLICADWLWPELKKVSQHLSFIGVLQQMARERSEMRAASALLQRIEDSLKTGCAPSSDLWQQVDQLPGSSGGIFAASLREARSAGLPILPTLRRFRHFMSEQEKSLLQARARCAQAVGQTISCAILVPIFAFALVVLLPGIRESMPLWLTACAGAMLLTGLGAAWIFRLVGRARWAGLAPNEQHWWMLSGCAGEQLLALVRSGQPPDIAWAKTLESLATWGPDLACSWGTMIWSPASGEIQGQGVVPARNVILGCGPALRKAIQVSLMEGRPCLERIEAVLESMRTGLQACLECELSQLANQALRPLFICVAPAMLGLLAVGVWLCWRTLGSGWV